MQSPSTRARSSPLPWLEDKRLASERKKRGDRSEQNALVKKLILRKTWLVDSMTHALASGEYVASTMNMPRQRMAQCARARRPSTTRMGRFLPQRAALEGGVSRCPTERKQGCNPRSDHERRRCAQDGHVSCPLRSVLTRERRVERGRAYRVESVQSITVDLPMGSVSTVWVNKILRSSRVRCCPGR